jgi:hypothetical protein
MNIIEYITGVFQVIGWGGLFLIFVISIVISTIIDYYKKKKEQSK